MSEADNFKNRYLQRPITFLTEENLDILEDHCRKAIRYERGVEHKVVLELLERYKEFLAEREEDKKKIDKLKKENKEILNSKIGIDLSYNDYIPKQKVKEVIKKIKEIIDIAEEQIESKIIIADSDSLNFGRKQAHGKDIELIEKLLEDK